ncbi:YheU family protein [Marinospirillum sp. MEB164]|uniref:YheU family protein n=1 Tax=Marinospirillum alkalitolerans TaxID=3123374 RepID=A0ABW8PV86_9GAMM
MHQRFVEIPFGLLETATLDQLLAAFVTRQGYDTTALEQVDQWVGQLKEQLKRGELVIMHDIETESTEVMTLQQAKSFAQGLKEE